MWQSISEDKLLSMIADQESLMESGCLNFWQRIKIKPQKWRLSPWGDDGGGFWIIAIIGNTAIYFNDIEDGFNFSCYHTFGQLEEYHCEQSDLLTTIDSFYQEVLTALLN